MTDSPLFIGLMSGTSLDGVDAVCCRFTPGFELVAHHFLAMPATLGEQLLALQSAQPDEIHLAQLAANDLAWWYSDAVASLLESNGLSKEDIKAIGCHGQTIRHRPVTGYSLQLNQPALLAEHTGIDVVCDFRSRDIAAGGQGAPLVPAFHQAIFSTPDSHRVIINVGGMSNLTNLPTNACASGFDCGPGNVLMDSWIQTCLREPYDRDGAWGATGTPIAELLEKLLKHPFLAAAPPKSCGREDFNLEFLHALLTGREAAADVQATLLEFTARGISEALTQHCEGATEAFVCGGGAKNGGLMTRLQILLPHLRVATTAQLGLPVDTVEASAFAWLAKAFTYREPGNLPTVTGARGPRVLGALYPA